MRGAPSLMRVLLIIRALKLPVWLMSGAVYSSDGRKWRVYPRDRGASRRAAYDLQVRKKPISPGMPFG